jgi:hypothetical protein
MEPGRTGYRQHYQHDNQYRDVIHRFHPAILGSGCGFYAAADTARLVTVSGRSTVQRAIGFPVTGSMVHLSKHLGVAGPASRVLVSVVGPCVIVSLPVLDSTGLVAFLLPASKQHTQLKFA